MEQSEIKYRAWITKMALRCNFVTDQYGRNPLTTKGWGYIRSARFWRFISLILVSTSSRYRNYMLSFLNTIEKEQQQLKIDDDTRKN